MYLKETHNKKKPRENLGQYHSIPLEDPNNIIYKTIAIDPEDLRRHFIRNPHNHENSANKHQIIIKYMNSLRFPRS